MSYDRQIDQVCPHLVAEEALYIGADRRAIRPMRPIASADSVLLRFNGEALIPSSGLQLPGAATGSKEGPFTLLAGVNDKLAVRVDQGPLQTVVLPPASALAPDRLAYQLNRQLTGVTFRGVGKRLQFRTASEGRGASVLFDATSTMTTLLGVPTPREFRGQTSIPGWTLVRDLKSLADRPTRLIIFDEPLRSFGDFVEISYTTVKQDCRRCGGIGVENDWRYGQTGEVAQVRDEALLIQELQKNFLTIRGSNSFHPFYGSTLIEAIGKKIVSGGLMQSLLETDIYQTFKAWNDIKRGQEEKVGQYVSDSEFPYRMLGVNIVPSKQDVTVVFLRVTVQNRSQKPIVLERGLRLPQAFDIKSFQQGNIRQSLLNPVFAG
jgi:hypothetical protein